MQRRVLAIAVLVVVSSAVSRAQTKASCTFNLFQLNPANPLNPSTEPNGVTDKRTVVGQASFQSTPAEGFIRYSDGTVAYFGVPNAAATYFTDRNVNAISIGNYSTSNDPTLRKGFMLNGKVFTPIVEPKAVIGTSAQGINKWNTIVGWYLDGAENPHGFKRSSNGSFVTLDFPGPGATELAGVNDNGMIVGNHVGHGVVYYRGKWTTLNYPGPSSATALFGISDAGVIVGESSITESGTVRL